MRLSKLFFACGLACASLAGAQSCSPWQPVDLFPAARESAGLVFDSSRQRMVMFGGLNERHTSSHSWYTPACDTWDWDSVSRLWARRYPVNHPGPRDSSAIAYDPVRHTITLFGGADAAGSPLGETWVLDSDTGQWAQRLPAVSPSARQGAAMFFDPLSQHIFMYGGYPVGQAESMWEWDPDASTWTSRPQAGAPSVRNFAPMVPEGPPGQFLMFGGLADRGPAQNDTWRYQTSSNVWTLVPTKRQPAPRATHALVANPPAGRVLLFGGCEFVGNGALGDTWEWISASNEWVERAPAVSPPARLYTTGAFDLQSQRPALMGGLATSGGASTASLGDLWEWDSTRGRWLLQHSRPSAPPIGALSCAYSPLTRTIVAVAWDGTLEPGTMWEWDGTQWTRLPATAPMYGAPPIAFDGQRIIALWPEGTAQRTYLWNGEAWAQGPSLPVTAGLDVQMSFDASRARVVLVSGLTRTTWEWDGTAWSQVFAGGPTIRTRFAMMYDPARRVIVLHGGLWNDTIAGTTVIRPDTWVWDGNFWSAAITAVPASACIDMALAHDPRGAENVLVSTGGTWVWGSQNQWVALPPSQQFRRRKGSLILHEASDQLVLISGLPQGLYHVDTSELVTLVRGCACFANCDSSTGSPSLTANDLMCFLNRFASADPYANCDGSTLPPTLSANDFQCFLNRFAAGCP